MKSFKLLIISILIFIPLTIFSQENPLKGKWQFNVELIKQECKLWINSKTLELSSLEGEKKEILNKELQLVKQIESSLNFSFSGLVYNFLNDTDLSVYSIKGAVGSQLNYELKNNILTLKYPNIKEFFIYRYEIKEGRLYIYEIVNGIERFPQVLDRI